MGLEGQSVSHPVSTAGCIALGEHACQVDAEAEALVACAAAFLERGLSEGSRCLHVRGAEDRAPALREALARRGIDVAVAEVAGALAFAGPESLQLRRGRFEPDAFLSDLEADVAEAASRGFRGLRVVADMSWTQLGHDGSERFIELESRFAEFLPRHSMAALCQYRRPRFGAEALRDAIRAHPVVVAGGVPRSNPNFVPPAELLGAPDAAAEVERLLASLGAGRSEAAAVAMCAWCKDIRDGEGWEHVEAWLARRSGLVLSHVMCPACHARIAPAAP